MADLINKRNIFINKLLQKFDIPETFQEREFVKKKDDFFLNSTPPFTVFELLIALKKKNLTIRGEKGFHKVIALQFSKQ